MATANAADDGSTFKGDEFSGRVHRHGTSGELVDPWCDLCYKETNKKNEASGFCPECNFFLCESCLVDHKKFPFLRQHIILQGVTMPKTQADRSVKYLDCDVHEGSVNDRFCMDHSKMVCCRCITKFHKKCRQKLISDLCTDLGSIDIQGLRDVTETIKNNITSVQNEIQLNKNKMRNQRREMIKRAKELRDDLILKIENAYSSTVSDIKIACDKKVSYLSNKVFALLNMITAVDQSILNIDKNVDVDITPHVFLQLQNIVSNVSQSQRALEDLKKQLSIVDLSFSTSPEISAFLSANKPLGSVKEMLSQLDLKMPTPEIAFPSPSRKSKTRAGRRSRNITQSKDTNMTPLNMKTTGDKQTCDIYGMAVTRNGILLLADWNNKKIKAVSPDNKILSSLTLSDHPYDITLIDDIKAAVSTNDKKLHILDISDTSSLAIQRSMSLGYLAASLAPCYNNLLVIQWTDPKCVKKITMTGAELWSVSTDHSGQKLFDYPQFVTTNIVNDKLTVLVTDRVKETITLLDANNGDVIKIVDVKGKNPYGLTVDNNGHVYVCCRRPGEICVWSADFSESKILLTQKDIPLNPVGIAYCNNTDEIFICYSDMDTVERFQLS